jgi:anti-anti-sigma factor
MSDIQLTFQDLGLGQKPAKLITFKGQLDETNVDHEAKKVYQVISEMEEPLLILDFGQLEYMNSKSIGYVTDWFTKVTEKTGTIAIVGPRPNILDILKVVGITQIITIYNTLEEAKTAMGGQTSEPQSAETPGTAQEVPSAQPEPSVAPEPPPSPATPEAPQAPTPAPAPEPEASPAPSPEAEPKEIPAAPVNPQDAPSNNSPFTLSNH